jgi:hypothetical protein
VTVGVIDSGIDKTQKDLAANISARSTDIILTRNDPNDERRHGTRVAGIIAAGFNQFGTIGVAYESTILSVRADEAGPCEDGCKYRSTDIARAVDYAVVNGARVINLSLGGDGPLGVTFEAALERAVSAGVVIAASAGNKAEADPSWPGRYVTDPRYRGAVIVVGASDPTGVLATFSSRAGVAADGYLVAPGVDVITDCDGSNCWRVGGTSFAAPHVAGGLATLLSAFPNLTGRQAVDILLRTARDGGTAGTDPIFGRGYMDLNRAFQPVGATAASTSAGVRAPFSPGGGLTGQAFGDAIARSGDLRTTIFDAYDRRFDANLAAQWRVAERDDFSGWLRAPTGGPAVTGGADLGVAAVSFAAGGAALTGPDGPAPGRLGLAAAFRADRAAALSLPAGAWRVSLWSEAGRDAGAHGFSPASASRSGLTLRRSLAGLDLGFGAGVLDEEGAALGSRLSARDGARPSARTGFVSADVALDDGRGRRWSLAGELGRTDEASFGPLLRSDGVLLTTAFSAQVAGDGWSLGLEQPLRIEAGALGATLLEPGLWTGPLVWSRRRIEAAPSGRELRLRWLMSRPVAQTAVLSLEAAALREPGHIAGAAPEARVLARLAVTR